MPERWVSMASKSCSPSSRTSPLKPARRRDSRVAHGAEVGGAPEQSGRGGAVGERGAEGLVEQDRRERGEARVRGGDLKEGVGEGVAPLGADARGGGVEIDEVLVA